MTDERITKIREYLDEDYEVIEVIVEDDPYRYVLGLDPGGTTGVAMLRYLEDELPELIYLHQIEGGKEGFYEWFAGSKLAENLDVASEVWVERNIKGADRTPLVVQGVMYGLWQEPDNLHWQEPKMKQLIGDDYLHEQNLWTPGKRHQMDALMHALVFLRNDGHEPTQKSLSGDKPEDTIAEEGEAEKAQIPQPGEGGEGSEQEGEGGEPQPGSAAEALAEAMKRMAEAAGEASEAMAKAAEAVGEGEPNGPGKNGQEGIGDEPVPDIEIKGERKRRERGGVFSGYDPAEDEGTVLFDE